MTVTIWLSSLYRYYRITWMDHLPLLLQLLAPLPPLLLVPRSLCFDRLQSVALPLIHIKIQFQTQKETAIQPKTEIQQRRNSTMALQPLPTKRILALPLPALASCATLPIQYHSVWIIPIVMITIRLRGMLFRSEIQGSLVPR
jgi:hypothetical protein